MGVLDFLAKGLLNATGHGAGGARKGVAGFLFGSYSRREVSQAVGAWRPGIELAGGTGQIAGRYMGGAVRTGPGVRGITGAFLKHAGPRLLAAEGIDYALNSPWGEEQSGMMRMFGGLASFGLKVGAFRHLTRGAIGSVLGRAGHATGDWNRFYNQYDWAARKLGGVFTKGSIMQGAAKLAGRGAVEVLHTPMRMAVGAPYALVGGSRALARLGGDMPLVGRAFAKIGGTSIGDVLTPRLISPAFGKPGRIMDKIARATRFTHKSGEAPIMSGFVALGAMAGANQQVKKFQREQQNWIPSQGYNPANYGRGISGMRRGSARNYGPSLTLMLHNNHSRVMP